MFYVILVAFYSRWYSFRVYESVNSLLQHFLRVNTCLFSEKEITVPVNDGEIGMKNLKTMDLIFLGIGAVVGTGIFCCDRSQPERCLIQSSSYHF